MGSKSVVGAHGGFLLCEKLFAGCEPFSWSNDLTETEILVNDEENDRDDLWYTLPGILIVVWLGTSKVEFELVPSLEDMVLSNLMDVAEGGQTFEDGIALFILLSHHPLEYIPSLLLSDLTRGRLQSGVTKKQKRGVLDQYHKISCIFPSRKHV